MANFSFVRDLYTFFELAATLPGEGGGESSPQLSNVVLKGKSKNIFWEGHFFWG